VLDCGQKLGLSCINGNCLCSKPNQYWSNSIGCGRKLRFNFENCDFNFQINNILSFTVNFKQLNEYCDSFVLCDTAKNLSCNYQTSSCECSLGFHLVINNCTNGTNFCTNTCCKTHIAHFSNLSLKIFFF
jgi:hypothetical protein